MTKFKSGYVSLTGRPNVGKSTLLNTILGEKIAIVTPKPQTTRNRIIGVKTSKDAQVIFIDTPGIHMPKHKLGELMVRNANESVMGVDIVLFMIEPENPPKDPINEGDKFIIEIFRKLEKPVFLLINKIDTVKKPHLLSVIDAYSRLYPFKEVIPISALAGDGIEILIKTIVRYLSEGPKYYPDDLLTDQIERFMISEIIREKIIKQTEEEIPHSVAVEITDWSEREYDVIFIHANIYVERDGQKGIIIGRSGLKLKTIGSSARHEIEKLLGRRVFLELWVKIKKNWRGSDRALKELGFK